MEELVKLMLAVFPSFILFTKILFQSSDGDLWLPTYHITAQYAKCRSCYDINCR